MLALEPLGMPEVLPALVVGCELPTDAPALPAAEDVPSWLLRIDQQAGGLSMSYPSVVGAVLRLEANLDGGRNDPASLVRGFRAMAEDPQLGVLASEFPVLRALVATWGDPYTRGELDALGTFVHGFFQVPPFESGVEAFVRCAEADPLAFAGWRMLSCAYREGAEALSPIDSYVLHHHRSDLLLTDDERFGPASLRVLEQVAWRLRLPLTPRMFLLWENSD